MSIRASLFLVGPHLGADSIPFYDDDPGHYKNTPLLTLLLLPQFTCATSDQSRDLARALDIDPGCPEEKTLNKMLHPERFEKIDWEYLKETMLRSESEEVVEKTLHNLKTLLMKYKWTLFYHVE